MSVLCMWRHDNASNDQFTVRQEYVVQGVLRTKNNKHYMIQPDIEKVSAQESLEHANTPSKGGFSLAKFSTVLGVYF